MLKADVVVVGGGINGWSCSVALAKTGRSVLIVDPQQHTATRFAAGILFPNAESRAVGLLGALNRQSVAMWHDWAAELGGNVLSSNGLIQVADSEDSVVQLERWRELFKEYSSDIDLKEVVELVPDINAERLMDALYLPDVASANPIDLLDALRFHGRGAGVRETHDAVVGVGVKDSRVTHVHLRAGLKVECSYIVGCAGLGRGWIPEGQRPDLTAQMGERVIVQLAEPRSHPIVGTPGGSLVPRGTNELWAGVTVREGDNNPVTTVAGGAHVLGNLLSWLPSLGEARILDLGAGLRPLSKDGLPFVGATGIEGLYLAGGQGRDGILQSPLTASVITGLIDHDISSPLQELAQHCSPLGRTC